LLRSLTGEAEFIFASLKIITVVGLIILAFIIDVGGAPGEGRLGFRYWYHPYVAMKSDITGHMGGGAGRFLGLWSTLVNAAFSYGGVEIVAVCGGESENPRKNVPKAVKRVFWRILFFYVLGSLAIGVTVPSTDQRLISDAPGAKHSPWVIAIDKAGIKVLPSIINAVILTSAASSANSFLYVGARYLFSLAQIGQAPKFLLWCTKKGVPVWCVLITWAISMLTYLSCSSGSTTVFGWFLTLCAITSLMTWCNILVAYLRFHAALKAQGVDRNTLVFKSRFQPYVAWVVLIFFLLVLLTNAWPVFTNGNFDTESFVAGYVLTLRSRCECSDVLTMVIATLSSRSTSSSTSSGRSSSARLSSRPRKPICGRAKQRSMRRSGLTGHQGTSLRRSGFGLLRLLAEAGRDSESEGRLEQMCTSRKVLAPCWPACELYSDGAQVRELVTQSVNRGRRCQSMLGSVRRCFRQLAVHTHRSAQLRSG